MPQQHPFVRCISSIRITVLRAQSHIAVGQIRESMKWLDSKSESSDLEWAIDLAWRDSGLIKEWLALAKADNSLASLLDGLCERA